jgi:hydroxypyruvate isomerase
MTRREVLKAGAASIAASVGATSPQAWGEGRERGLTEEVRSTEMSNAPKFSLKYAPHFDMFRHHAGNDPLDQLQFAADEGFHAWEDNGMRANPQDRQSQIGAKMAQLGITMGVFVANTIDWARPTLTTGQQQHIDKFIADCEDSVECAKRTNAKWMTVVPGTIDAQQDMGYQTANVVEALRRGAEVFEPHELVMVLEPLNFRDHPNLFLTGVAQAFEICRAVDSPSCKILDDLYHQQIQVGNLLPNIDKAWSEIAYFQIGDNPGRNEPLTGEINYRNVFGHISRRGFKGVLGMEHGNSVGGREGERKLIDAYRWCDSYDEPIVG